MDDPVHFWLDFWHVLTLRSSYNATLVILGTTSLGIASGIVGTFAVLRKRALMADALGHATLPGVVGGFLISLIFGATGPEILPLLIGGGCSGLLGIYAVQFLVRHPRIREDAAIGLVLSTFFGLGIVLLSVVQTSVSTQTAGLDSYIYGQASAMTRVDVLALAGISLLVGLISILLRNPFGEVCFDSDFAATTGWPVDRIDLFMMGLVAVVCVVGIPAVGLMLVVAFLIVPCAAARLWSIRLFDVLVISGLIGGISGWFGSALSSSLPNLPTGPVIVLVAGAIFAFSLFFAPRRGLFSNLWNAYCRNQRISEDHALEHLIERDDAVPNDGLEALFSVRGWSARKINRLMRRLQAKHFVQCSSSIWSLTQKGRSRGLTIQRNHRLWTQYLISHADVAANHVDWSVDQVEHVLSDNLVNQLEDQLRRGYEP